MASKGPNSKKLAKEEKRGVEWGKVSQGNEEWNQIPSCHPAVSNWTDSFRNFCLGVPYLLQNYLLSEDQCIYIG